MRLKSFGSSSFNIGNPNSTVPFQPHIILLHYCAQFTLSAPALLPGMRFVCTGTIVRKCTLSAPAILNAMRPVCIWTIARNAPCLHLYYCVQCALSAPAFLRAIRPACTCTMRSLYATVLFTLHLLMRQSLLPRYAPLSAPAPCAHCL